MIIKKEIDGKQWCKFKGNVEFLIRPSKFSELDVVAFKEGNFNRVALGKFLYCIVDWKGLTEEDKKTKLECSKENKEMIYDYYNDVRLFILNSIKKVESDLDKSLKN